MLIYRWVRAKGLLLWVVISLGLKGCRLKKPPFSQEVESLLNKEVLRLGV